MSNLWTPRDPNELYRERSFEGVFPLRPIFQGDIFRNIKLLETPSSGDDFAMVVTHPCSMLTSQAQYLPTLEMVRVREYEAIPLDAWAVRAFELLPLPNLEGADSSKHYAAFFHERAVVPTPTVLDGRICNLSLEGVIALQQRLIHESSRVVVPYSTLRAATEPRWHENELLEDWNTKFIREEDPDLILKMADEAAIFDALINRDRPVIESESQYAVRINLQKELENPNRVASVRQSMNILYKKEAGRRSKLAK